MDIREVQRRAEAWLYRHWVVYRWGNDVDREWQRWEAWRHQQDKIASWNDWSIRKKKDR